MKVLIKRKKHIVLSGLMPLAIAFVSVVASSSVQAQDKYCGLYFDQSGSKESRRFSSCWYGAIGVGVSQVDPEGVDSNGWYTPSNGDSSSGWNITVGRRFAPKWFAELKYADLGEAELTTSNLALDQAYPNAAITYKVPSLMAGYYLFEPRDGFNVFAKAGLSAISSKKEKDGDTVLFEEVENVQLALGLGAQYDFRNSPWLLKFDLDSYDRDALYAGISIGRYFGGKAKPASKKTKPAVAAPILVEDPQPLTAAEPARALCKKLESVSKGVQFETNSSALTEVSKVLLDKVAQGIVCQPGIRIEVQAHTDSDGSDNYNLNLSNKRALSVSQYLLDNGAASCNLTSQGFGETLPVASNATSEGKAKNRRVELKVVGEDICEVD